MQYELRQKTIVPRRNTYQVLIDRNGDVPATRYQEGTVGIQPSENFHYRPVWDPAHEIYDPGFSALRLTDPEGFADPRQYYYAPYVAARTALHDAFGKTLDYIDKRALFDRMSQQWRSVLLDVVVPLRHCESGAQLITVAGARFAWGTPIAQCLTYAAFDRIGQAQMISRIGISIAQGTDEALRQAKTSWCHANHLQPLRRMTEQLISQKDWAVGVIGQDLVDQILYPVLYQHLDEVALLSGAGFYSLLTQHLAAWHNDHRRWLDALYQTWAGDSRHGASNCLHLTEIVGTWLPRAAEATAAIAAEVDQALGNDNARTAHLLEVEEIAKRFNDLAATVNEELA